MYGKEDNTCCAPTLDIYNRLKHGKFNIKSYSVLQIYLTKENPSCSTSTNIAENFILQASIWMIWGNNHF